MRYVFSGFSNLRIDRAGLSPRAFLSLLLIEHDTLLFFVGRYCKSALMNEVEQLSLGSSCWEHQVGFPWQDDSAAIE